MKVLPLMELITTLSNYIAFAMRTIILATRVDCGCLMISFLTRNQELLNVIRVQIPSNVTHSATEWAQQQNELGYAQNEPKDIYTNNKSVKTLIDLFHVGGNSAHLVMRLNYLYEWIQRKVVRIKYVNIDDYLSVIGTKLLAIPKFEKKLFWLDLREC